MKFGRDKIPERELVERTASTYLLNSSVAGFAISIIGTAASAVVSYIFIKLLGEQQYGSYVWLLSAATMLSSVFVLGLNRAATRLIPRLSPEDNLPFVIFSMLAVSGVAFGCFMVAMSLKSIFPEHTHLFNFLESEECYLVSLLALAIAIATVLEAILRSMRVAVFSRFVWQLLRPLISVTLLTVSLLAIKPNAKDLLCIEIVAFSIVTVIFFYRVYYHGNREHTANLPELKQAKKWGMFALGFFLISSVSILFNQADIFLLGLFESKKLVGVYQLGKQFAILVAFSQTTVNLYFTPIISELFKSDEQSELQLILTKLSKFNSIAGVLTFLFLFVFGDLVLGIYGETYRAGFWPMIIICLGQLFNCMSGPVGAILLMTNYAKLFLKISVFSSIFGFLLFFFLIPMWGLFGAATGVALFQVVINLACLYFVRIRLGLKTTALDLLLR